MPIVLHRSLEEFYDLLRDSHAPDSLSFYDDRLAPHMGGWKGSPPRATPVLNAAGERVQLNK
jgi:hypothetical protein